jgi:hypothetical protein
MKTAAAKIILGWTIGEKAVEDHRNPRPHGKRLVKTVAATHLHTNE